jgi:membrane protease YdiL (CAAX protease family)
MATPSTYRPGSSSPGAEQDYVHGPHAADQRRSPSQGAYGITARPMPMLLAAVAWSWAWWAGSIALGGVETLGGALVYLVGGFGPTVAVVATLWRSSPAYRSSFRRRLLMGREAPIWWLAAVLLAVSPKLVAMAVAAAGGHVATGEPISLLAVPVSLAFGIMVVAIEEPLWRGVALDAFGQAKVKASLIIGLVWSVWHVPLFAIKGTFQHELGLGTVDFFVFSIGVVGLSVLLTWLVVGSGGSILLAMVAHFLINMTGNFLPDDTTVRVLEMIVIWLVAAALLYRLRRWERTRPNATTTLQLSSEDAR